MVKRTLIAGLWFVSLWSLGGAMSVYLGVPRPLMLLPTALCSVGVWIGLAMYDDWRESRQAHRETPSRTRLMQNIGRSLTPDLDA
jgi:hypothetical protein